MQVEWKLVEEKRFQKPSTVDRLVTVTRTVCVTRRNCAIEKSRVSVDIEWQMLLDAEYLDVQLPRSVIQPCCIGAGLDQKAAEVIEASGLEMTRLDCS